MSFTLLRASLVIPYILLIDQGPPKYGKKFLSWPFQKAYHHKTVLYECSALNTTFSNVGNLSSWLLHLSRRVSQKPPCNDFINRLRLFHPRKVSRIANLLNLNVLSIKLWHFFKQTTGCDQIISGFNN